MSLPHTFLNARGMPAAASGSETLDFTFTNASVGTNYIGPSLSQCTTAYAAAADWSKISSSFSVTAGYQSFNIPYTGNYQFTLYGGCGGISSGFNSTFTNAYFINSYYRAPGAKVMGTYSLTAGDTITILVGQQGGDDSTTNNAGGAGGTWVTLGSQSSIVAATDSLLFVAGGGGGYGNYGGTNNYIGGQGQSTESNTNSNNGASGSNGNGGSYAGAGSNSGAGGGYFTGAASNVTSDWTTSITYSRGALAFRKGGKPGLWSTSNSSRMGGFGGGGNGSHSTSQDNDKGGGGGYSGGSHAFDAYKFGNGGGSFSHASATSVSKTTGGALNSSGSSDGLVKILKV
jgi:hypothetical protein